jgi:tetratricopeptide (TPR) repeat protein
MEQGLFVEASATLDEAAAAAAGIGDARLEARAILNRRNVDMYAGDPNSGANALEATEKAIPIFEAASDRAGLARAYRLLFFVHGTIGRNDEAVAAAEKVIEHAKAAGDARMAARGAQGYATAALSGSLPTSQLIGPCEQLMLDTAGDRKSQAVVAGVLAQLYAMRGDFAKGREYSEQQREKLADLGPSVTAWSTSLDRARVELLAGDAEAAERELRADDAALAAIDERYFRSTIVAMLAGVLASRGLREEAEQAVVIARELADEDDVASQVLWRTAHARLLADASQGELATDAAERAVEIATEGDDIELLADAKAALGEVLWQLGRQESAEPPFREALALYERKEDIASATRVRLRLEVLLSGADPTAVG